jgi:hypothetical protein
MKICGKGVLYVFDSEGWGTEEYKGFIDLLGGRIQVEVREEPKDKRVKVGNLLDFPPEHCFVVYDPEEKVEIVSKKFDDVLHD